MESEADRIADIARQLVHNRDTTIPLEVYAAGLRGAAEILQQELVRQMQIAAISQHMRKP